MYVNRTRLSTGSACGYSLVEVLVTMVVLAVGLLGMAGLLVKMNASEAESYQRAQALALLQDMASRMVLAGQTNAPNYVSATALGTGDTQPASCSGLAAGNAYDWCVWSNALKGASETAGGANVGSMIDARGCIEPITPIDATPGTCTPGVYRISVVWQGLTETVAPAGLSCGQNSYGNDALRRAVSTRVIIGLPAC